MDEGLASGSRETFQAFDPEEEVFQAWEVGNQSGSFKVSNKEGLIRSLRSKVEQLR